MAAPSPERLDVLRPVERLAYGIADFIARRMRWASTFWQDTFVAFVAFISVGRRVIVDGVENLEGLGPESRVLLVANHRSFFDFFTVGAICLWRTRLPRRSFFPVRATFFYDKILGIFVNGLLAGMSMFPPILRDRSRQSFNLFALERVASELARPGTMIGMHPEGTRNKGPDPYSFLNAKPGVGKIVFDTPPGAIVVPVFVIGLGNALHKEIYWNFFAARRHPVHVRFGRPVDMSDLLERESRPATQRLVARRCLAAIGEVGRQVHADRVALGAEAATPTPEAPGAPPGGPPPPDPAPGDRTDSAPGAEGS